MRAFDGYIAIDWSGADGRYVGISIAACVPGNGAPRLIAPEGARWTRTAVAAWLDGELKSGRRLLIGCDFAFGLPFEEHGYFAGAAPGVADIFGLWDAVDDASVGAGDFGCAPVLADPRFAPLYWQRGRQPAAWTLRRRRAELACAAATGTHPECVFKLIGAKQVGKASLTGIRVLRHVRLANRSRLAVWPFEPVGTKSVLVEIYPTLFRKQAAGSVVKLRTRDALNAALRKLGARGVAQHGLSDHDTDALISAAGLRRATAERSDWLAPADPHVRREGWIFGVPMNLCVYDAPAMKSQSKKLKPIPQFRDEAEERAFWERHDSTDYVDWDAAKRHALPKARPTTRG
jgi:CopG antitoxin of type II toxin-antitoxin system